MKHAGYQQHTTLHNPLTNNEILLDPGVLSPSCTFMLMQQRTANSAIFLHFQLSPGGNSIGSPGIKIRMAPYFQLAPSCDSMRTDSAKRVSDKKDGSGPQRHFDSGAIAPLELHGQTLLLAAHSDCLRSSCR